jgi:putative membrane-bound dehydrogenase-like protein
MLVFALVIPRNWAAERGVFRAGAHLVDVTPTNYPVLVNAMFTERTATNAVDRLHVRALALDDGSTRIVFAIVDTCMIARDLIDRAKEQASRATGVPTDRMLVSATHTHSAPSAMGCLGSRMDTNYARFLEPRIAEAIVRAVKKLQPARIGWGVTEDWEHTFNRRWIRRPDRMLTDPFGDRNIRAHMHPGHNSPDAIGPSGPVDPDLSVVALQTLDGRPLALLANYSQHYYDSPLLSSDYFGRFCGHIATNLNAGARPDDASFVAMISQGTSGDLARMDYGGEPRNIGYDAYARELAEKAAGVVRSMKFRDWVPLKMAERTLALNYRTPTEARLAWARQLAATLQGRLPRTQPEIYALESIYLHERPRTELKLQAIGIGDLGIAAIPNEVYAITGLKLKAQSPFATTFNIELANGAEGYIPPPEQHKLGGYTTWPARTAGLEVQAEPRIVETLLSLLEDVSGKPRRAMVDTHGPYPKAVLESKPAAYWRLNESVIPTAHDATGEGRSAAFEDGVALYLPGASQTIGFQPPRPETQNAFSGDQINRAPHFAGGRIRASLPLKETYSVELWFWNGLQNDARAVTGYFFSRGPDLDASAAGDHLGIGGTHQPEQTGRLIFFNGNDRNTVLVGRTPIERRQWHHVVLVREGRKVAVYLNGNSAPEISGEADVTVATDVQSIFFGGRCDNFANFEGKLDEVAVYDRLLATNEIATHYRASGFPARVSKPTASAIASPPLSPAESLAKIHVPDGFKVELVAAEPLLESPVAIDWDERGRLWVVEMVDYPLGLDGKGKPGGRVRVLEDVDGDGRYDKTTLFADGLKFPTGLLTWRDGVLVTAAPEILFLKDNDGDGKADVKQVFFSGFLEGNQQLRVNSLRWGIDNWVYCASGAHHGGYGSATKIKSHLNDRVYEIGSRDFRFRPDTGELEAQSGPSQFGRNPDDWGNWFGVQNSWPLWHYVLQDHYIRRNPHVPSPDPVQQVVGPKNPRVYPASQREKRFHSFNEAGHFTSACAAMIYRDELLFGSDGNRHAFTCEPFHNLVQHNVVVDDGVSFASRRASNEIAYDFFASEDRWCRPVMTRAGPDGALWVVDMYRYMIEHPEWLPPEGRAELVPNYRLGEERGRIYRVAPKGNAVRKPARLSTLSLPELVDALDSPNGWQRDKVQMLLLWLKDAAAGPLLEALARESKNPLARLHALGTLDGLGLLQPRLVERALADEHPGVRVNALRLAERRADPSVVVAATKLVSDPDRKVVLQLACTLGEWSDRSAGVALGKIATTYHADKFIAAAVLSSALPHSAALVDAVVASEGAAQAVFNEPLTSLALATNQRDSLARLLQPVFGAQSDKFAVREMTVLSQFLDTVARKKSSWRALMNANEGDALATRLRFIPTLFTIAKQLGTDVNQSEGVRVAAAGLLARDDSFRADALKTLAALLVPKASAETQRAAVRVLGVSGHADVPKIIADVWSGLGPEIRLAALDEMLGRELWALALVGLVEQGRISPNALDASRRARLLRHASERVKQTANKVFSANGTSSRAEVVQKFRPALTMAGDASRGAVVFNKLCVTCHKRGDAGNDVGPNLQSVVNHPAEKLLVSILDPNASIEPGYTAYSAQLADGEELYGIVTAETGNSLVMKQADGKTRTLLRSAIATLRSANLSLMPEGLESGMNPQELADLIRFLQTP